VRLLFYLFDLVVAILMAGALTRALQGLFGGPREGSRGRAASPARGPETRQGEMARDPTCGMFVSTELTHRLTRGNETLHFCSRECLERYQAQELRVKG
jgi:YHS domain-containing protein